MRVAHEKALVHQARQLAVVFAIAAGATSALAADFKLGEAIETTISATITTGTGIRTENPSTANYGSIAGSRVGRGGGLTSANSGGPDLNFERGSSYSTVLKGFLDLDVHGKGMGAFTRLKAWHDYELENGNRPYGNFPNGFAQGVPLSDNGFAREAKFTNTHFTDAYVYGKLDFEAEKRLDARLGRQVVNWGTSQFFRGGINVINPTDFAAEQRPGSLPQESKIPVGMLYANFAQAKQWGVDGFAQFESRHDVINGCGTYFNVATYAPTGCLQANVLPTVPEATAFRNGQYVHRADDVEAKDSGELGLSLRYAAAELGTEFRGYAMNYHSRSATIRGTNPNIAGGFGSLAPPTFSRLTNPNGVKYALMYVEDIELYGLSFDTRRGQATRVFGELAYRPNQPLSLNFADLADAFVARNPDSLLNRPASGKNALALPPGATFDAFDRFKVTTATLGITRASPASLVRNESSSPRAGLDPRREPARPRHPALRAFRRLWRRGRARLRLCGLLSRQTCALDGFVTSNSWGYRGRISATWNDAFLGASLTPSAVAALGCGDSPVSPASRLRAVDGAGQ